MDKSEQYYQNNKIILLTEKSIEARRIADGDDEGGYLISCLLSGISCRLIGNWRFLLLRLLNDATSLIYLPECGKLTHFHGNI
jgi:hypothetical protein